MTPEEQLKMEQLEKRVADMEQTVTNAVSEARTANERTNAALQTIEDMSTMFSEHVSSLDRRMEDIAKIFLSKLEKKVPKMVE